MIWLNTTQINQALIDMYNVLCQLPIEAEEMFAQKIYEHMCQRNNTSSYTFKVFKGFYHRALQYGVDIEDSSILEIGAGKPLGTGIFWNFAGARKYTSIDKFTQINLTDLWAQRFETILDMNLFYPENFMLDSLFQKNGDQYSLNEDKIRLIQGSFETYPLEEKSFDFIYSNAVLEHMTNIELSINKMYAVLKDDGVIYHGIDLREHHTNLRRVPDKDTSIDFLKYSREEWERMYPPGSNYYLNRLRVSDFIKMFENAGFRIIDLIDPMSMPLDETVYSEIHPEFHKYSLEDLRKTSLSIALKKA